MALIEPRLCPVCGRNMNLVGDSHYCGRVPRSAQKTVEEVYESYGLMPDGSYPPRRALPVKGQKTVEEIVGEVMVGEGDKAARLERARRVLAEAEERVEHLGLQPKGRGR